MASENEKQQGEGKGFAGLASMVSDVDAAVASAPTKAPSEVSTSSTQQFFLDGHLNHQEQPKPSPQTYQAPEQPSGSTGKWLFGIAAVLGVIWLANQSDSNRSSSPAYSPGSSSASAAPVFQPPVVQPQALNGPAEEKPSIGRNNVLSTVQIHYCLAEKIRIDAAEVVINNYANFDVDQFNEMVNDYNSRCGEFRYRKGTLESAKRDVEQYRDLLQAEGRSRFVHSTPEAPRPLSPTLDLSAQGKSEEKSAPMPITTSALGGSQSTTPDHAWVSGSNWYCNDGYRKNGDRCEAFNVPDHAWVSGSNWYCNDGYRKNGDRCEALNVPDHAWVSGSNWYCNDGYRKNGDRCDALNVPAHAWVSGSNWYCNDGYRKNGDRCDALNVPDHAWVSGSNWYCNDGYKKSGDKCVSIF